MGTAKRCADEATAVAFGVAVDAGAVADATTGWGVAVLAILGVAVAGTLVGVAALAGVRATAVAVGANGVAVGSEVGLD